jgi:hypothetical protein
LTTYDWIKSFLKITIERRAIYVNLENKINTLYLARRKFHAQKRNDADGKLQKVSGRCLILCSDHYVFSLRIPFIKITMQTIDRLAERYQTMQTENYRRSVGGA